LSQPEKITDVNLFVGDTCISNPASCDIGSNDEVLIIPPALFNYVLWFAQGVNWDNDNVWILTFLPQSQCSILLTDCGAFDHDIHLSLRGSSTNYELLDEKYNIVLTSRTRT
jgi:hypothetical protein